MNSFFKLILVFFFITNFMSSVFAVTNAETNEDDEQTWYGSAWSSTTDFLGGAFPEPESREENAFQVQVGLNLPIVPLGLGTSVGYHISKNIYVGVEFFTLNATGTFTETTTNPDGTESTSDGPDVDFKFNTTQYITRISPVDDGFFEHFYLQLGIAQRDWTAQLSGEETFGSGSSEKTANYTLDYNYPTSLAYNFGVGFNFVYSPGFSLNLGAGAQLGDAPEAENFTVDDSSISETDKQERLAEIKDKYDPVFESFANATYLFISLGWNF